MKIIKKIIKKIKEFRNNLRVYMDTLDKEFEKMTPEQRAIWFSQFYNPLYF